MAWITPCKNCPRKGCGSYHDSCPEYQDYVEKRGNYKDRLEQTKINDTLIDLKRNVSRPGNSPGLTHKDYSRRKK